MSKTSVSFPCFLATVVIAIAMLSHSASAQVVTVSIYNSQIVVVGGVLDLTAGGTTHAIIDWDDVTMSDARVIATNAHTVNIRNSHFTDVSIDLVSTTAVGSGPEDAVSVWRIHDNVFDFTGATAFYQANTATISMDLENFAGRKTFADFTFKDNSIGASNCAPLSADQLEDRTAGLAPFPVASVCNTIGTSIVGTSAASRTLVDAYVVAEGVLLCGTNTDTDLAHAVASLQPLGIWGNVGPSTGGDVVYGAATCNSYCTESGCSALTALADPNVRTGRFFLSDVLTFDAGAGTVTIEFITETTTADAITVFTNPFVDIDTTLASGLCMNRPQDAAMITTDWTDMHSAGERFGDLATTWTIVGTETVDDDGTGANLLGVTRYRAVLDMTEFATCAGVTVESGSMTMTTTVVHTEMQANDLPNVVAVNWQTVTVFFFNNQIFGIGSAGDPLSVTAAEEVVPVAGFPTNTGSEITFPIETFVNHAAGEVAVTFASNALTTTVVTGSGGACTTGTGVVETCQETFTLAISDTCINDGIGALADAGYCKQLLTIKSSQVYSHIAVAGTVPIEINDRVGDGHLMRSATMSFSLSWRETVDASVGSTAGVTVSVEVMSEMDEIRLLVPSQADQRSFTEGEELIFFIRLDSPDYTTTGWNTHGLEMHQLQYCAADPNSAYTIGTVSSASPDVSGCNAFVPFAKRQKLVDWRDTACDSSATGGVTIPTTDYALGCHASSGLKVMNHHPIAGRCNAASSNPGAQCVIPANAGTMSTTAMGAEVCAGGGACVNGASNSFDGTEVPRLNAEFAQRYCRTSGNLGLLNDCTAGTGSCDAVAECTQTASHLVYRVRAPVLHWGGSGTSPLRYADITFNVQVFVYDADITSATITSRRLLSVTPDSAAASGGAAVVRAAGDTNIGEATTSINTGRFETVTKTVRVAADPVLHQARLDAAAADRAQKHLRGRNREVVNENTNTRDAFSTGRIGMQTRSAVSDRDRIAVDDVSNAGTSLKSTVFGLITMASVGLAFAGFAGAFRSQQMRRVDPGEMSDNV